MHIEQNAPTGASGGHTGLARFLTPEGASDPYMAVLARLARLRDEYEQAITAAIDGLDAIDALAEDLEESDPVGRTVRLGDHGPDFDGCADAEPTLAARELVTCGDGPAATVRKVRKSRTISEKHVADRSGDQTRWAQAHGVNCEHDLEADVADDEPSLGAPEQRPTETVRIDGEWLTRSTSQETWAAGTVDEREGDLADSADDREADPVDEGEHTLGATTAIDQDQAWAGSRSAIYAIGGEAEPSLGFTGASGRGHPEDVRHGDDDGEEEPSLGSPDPVLFFGCIYNTPDGRMFKPMAPVAIDQELWFAGGTDDRESEQGGESGIADGDGLIEQMLSAHGIVAI